MEMREHLLDYFHKYQKLLGAYCDVLTPSVLPVEPERTDSHSNHVFNDSRLHVVLNKYDVIREAFVGRGFEFNDRDPDLMGNKYEDFSDGKNRTQLLTSFN